MRAILAVPTLLICLFLLTACPFNTVIPLAEKGEESIDERLLGTWVTRTKGAAVEGISLSPGDEEGTYDVWVEKLGKIFMAGSTHFTGWTKKLGGVNFLILQEIQDDEPMEIYYAYAYRFDEEKVLTYILSYEYTDMSTITTTEAYQEAVRAAMKHDDALIGEEKWKRK